MTNCSPYGFACDQCTPDSLCRDYLPGIAGFCYRYSDSISSGIQTLLPAISAVCGFSLLGKKILPARETSDAWISYAKKTSSAFCSSIGTIWKDAKESIASRPGETHYQQITRLASIVFSSLKQNPVKVALSTATVIVPRFVPSLLQMPAITSLILGTLAVLKNGNDWAASIKDLGTQRSDETPEQYKIRMRNNALKAAGGLGLLAGVGAAAGILIREIIQKSTTYNVWLPWQTPATAFMEYIPPALIHGLQALRDSKNHKKTAALFHALAALSTLAFPCYIIATQQPLRLHHFWIGQFFQMLPAPSAKIFGLFLSLDGWVQIITPTGYQNYDWDNWQYSSYGCDNVVMDHFNKILFAGSLALLFDGISKILFASKRPDDLTIWQTIKLMKQKICCFRQRNDESTRLLDDSFQNYLGQSNIRLEEV